METGTGVNKTAGIAGYSPLGIQKAVEELVREPFSVLFGAGLSSHSGIPLANDFVRAVLQLLHLSEEEQSDFMSARLPFESVMEVLLDIAAPDQLFNIFEGKEKGPGHLLFAKLAGIRHLRILATTNVDTLMEKALDDTGVPYTLYYTDCDLKGIQWGAKQLPLIKLHGTVGDRKSLALTIRRVASRHLVASRQEAIREILLQKDIATIVVFGYSCTDRFDINPAISSLQNKSQNVVLVEHGDVLPEEVSVEALGMRTGSPFKGFPGKLLRCNGDDFIRALSIKYLGRDLVASPAPCEDWRYGLYHWYECATKDHGPEARNYIAGLLFRIAEKYKMSNSYFLRAGEFGKSPGAKSTVFQSIADNLRDLGKYPEAVTYLRKVLASSYAHGLARRQARALATLGVISEDCREHQRAINYYKRAKRIARKAGDRELEGICAGNIGIACKNIGDYNSLQKAILFHENALRIARERGDKGSEGRTLGNLGITYSDLGDKPRAVQYYRQAMEIANDLGDTKHVGIWSANAGMDLVYIDQSEARRYLDAAVNIFSELDLPHLIAECRDAFIRLICVWTIRAGARARFK